MNPPNQGQYIASALASIRLVVAMVATHPRSGLSAESSIIKHPLSDMILMANTEYGNVAGFGHQVTVIILV